MDPSLEVVTFVTRAENRVDALLALSAGPQTRPQLQEATGVPRATLSRILADFRERGLAQRSGHEFALTSVGRLLAGELRSLSDAVDVVREVQALDPWLPLAELDVGPRDLTDANVTLPTQVDPLAPIRRTAEVLETSDRVRGLCNNVVPGVLQALREAVVENGLAVEVAVAVDAFEAVTDDPDLRDVLTDLLATGRLDLAVFDEPLPILAIDADDTVLLEVADDDGAIRGLVETQSEAVRSWFDSTFSSYRRDAEPEVTELLTT